MLRLHSAIRLISVMLLLASVFISESINTLLPIYALVFAIILVTGISVNHLRFVFFITTPLLIALLLVWGWLIEASQVPEPHQTGIHYAFFMWLRVVVSGGLLQCLFIPLIEKPIYLKNFLERTGAGVAMSTLTISSIIFLPEIGRRVGHITDARRAQGRSLRGVKGLIELPTLLMPLVSSLLDTASQRAEFLSHRGILDRSHSKAMEINYSVPLSVFALVVAMSAFITISLTRFYL